jgi:hypothetical protein
MGRVRVENVRWRWELTWRRNFFLWEIMIYNDFLAVINGFQPLPHEDGRRWRAEP